MLREDLHSSSLFSQTHLNINELAESLNTTLSKLLEIHAPLLKKNITTRPYVPWFSDEIKAIKRRRRKAEKLWRKTNKESDLMQFKFIKNKANYLMHRAKCDFYTRIVNKNSHNQSKLFSIAKNLLTPKNNLSFSNHQDKNCLVNELGQYFISKIDTIRSQFNSNDSHMTDRIKYVQVDDRSSNCVDVTSGVPQGSILGPILFNLYVNDLPDVLPREIACHQYADDTTLHRHCKPSDLQQGESELQCALNNMSSWSQECNLALNSGKTKTRLFSTLQRSRVHHLHEYVTSLCIGGNQLERLDSVRLLGTQLHHHLTWTNEITKKISSC